MRGIIKIVKSVEELGLLIKGVSETIGNGAKDQKGGFLGMLFGTLAASLLGSLLARKEIVQAGEGEQGTVIAGQDF